MELTLAIVLVLFVLAVILTVLLAAGILWYRRAARGGWPGSSRADAVGFLRNRGDDPRLWRHLGLLAADPRTPAMARALLTGLARYLSNPVVLAPDFVPVLGQVDEVAIGSLLLWLAWRSLPFEVWDAYFPPTTASPQRVAADVGPAEPSSRTMRTLRHYERAGRHDELLRFLDQTLPEWPVASTLVQVARELLELERGVAIARAAGAPEAVTSRLTREAQAVAEPLWRLADRITAAAAYRVDSPRLRQELEQENEKLARLLPAIRDARAGLAELTLSGFGGRDEFRRAEGRFRALAATARELQELDV